MKVALIGIGKWGQTLLKELRHQTEVKYECDSKTDLEPVFNDPEVKAVFIATPTDTHFRVAKRALEAGKHVFLEKPGTDSSEKLAELVRLAREKGLKLAVGYEFVHHPAAQRLREILAGQEIRKIYFDWQKWGAFKDDSTRHLFCHEVSIARFLGIDFVPRLREKTSVISSSDIVAIDSEKIESRINRVSPFKQKTVTVLTNNRSLVWSNDDLYEIVGEDFVKIDLPASSSVSAEINDFIDAISKNRTPFTSGEFALEVYSVIERV